jgi:hypothetical protein
MVDVKIHDRHPPKTMGFKSMERRHSDIVEDAKAHGLRRLRVVARRPHDGEGRPRLPRHDSVNRRHRRSRGPIGCLPRARIHKSVAAVESDKALTGSRKGLPHGGQVRPGVYPSEHGVFGFRSLCFRKAQALKALQSCGEAVGTLRMAWRDPMPRHRRMRDKKMGHALSIDDVGLSRTPQAPPQIALRRLRSEKSSMQSTCIAA